MVNDYRTDYWKEALDCSLDALGLTLEATSEQRNAVAKDLLRAHEMWSEASGEINIPNPQKEETRSPKEHLREVKELELQREIFRNAYADKIGLHPSERHRVALNNGCIEIWPT